MASTIHVQIDGETEAIRRRLHDQLGWTDSQIVCAGIQSLAWQLSKSTARTIVGLGQFESGEADLGSDKRHLHGFGK